MPKIRSLIVPIVTPKFKNSVDLTSLKRLLKFLIKNKVDGIFTLGTTGEFQYLSMKQKEEILALTQEALSKTKTTLLVGISAKNIKDVIWLTGLAYKYDAQAVVLAPLYGHTKPNEQLIRLMQSSSLPIMLYNNPHIQAGKNLNLASIKRVSINDKIIGIKDSSGNWNYFQSLLKLTSAKFKVFQGEELLAVKSIAHGASGLVAGTANVYPGLFKTWVAKGKISQPTLKHINQKIQATKTLSSNCIKNIKTKLVEHGLIRSAAMFKK